MAFESGIASNHLDLYAKLQAFLVAGPNAQQTLTLTANAADTETVTIDSKVYTFQAVLTNVDGNVLIGATESDTLNNLHAAVNLDPAGSGTLYAAATTVHPTARAVRGAGNTLLARAKTPGPAGNSIATTETLANGSWGAATMTGASTAATGTLTLTGNALDTETVTIDGKVYTFDAALVNLDGHVLIGATASDTLDNLIAAINLAAGAGTLYATLMTTHPSVAAAAGVGDTMTLTAKAKGTGGNSIATTTTVTGASFAGATLSGGTGTDWWKQLSATSASSSIYQAPGISGADEIHFGFGYSEDVGADTYCLRGWMFRSYNPALTYSAQPGYSGTGYHPVWNQPTPYWFFANAQRVIVVTKISTVFTASYLGKILPYGTPSEWPQPYYMSLPYSSFLRYSSVNESVRNFFDPGNHSGSRMLNPSGVWWNVCNFEESQGEATMDGVNYIWPYAARIGTAGSAQSRYRELRDNVDDSSYTLWPLVLCGENPNTDMWGELDGAYACPAFDAASEDIIVESNEDHLLVQNVFRTARYNYAAIKMA